MTTKVLFVVFLVAVAMVMPSFAWVEFQMRGLVCRFVNSSTEAVINETSCPFSDMDPPPYVCVNSSRGISNNQGNGGNGGHGGHGGHGGYGGHSGNGGDQWGNWWGARPSTPPIRKDTCVLQLDIRRSCTNDSDCPSFPGLIMSTCVRARRFSFCAPEASSVVLAMLAANPCEIRVGGRVIFTDLTQCSKRKFGPTHYQGGSSSASRICENSASLTARVNGRTYDIKTCVPGRKSNNNGGNINP